MNKFNPKTAFAIILILIFVVGLFLLFKTPKPNADGTISTDKGFSSFFGNRKLKTVDETTVPGAGTNNKYNADGTLNPNYDPNKDATDNNGTDGSGSGSNGTDGSGNGNTDDSSGNGSGGSGSGSLSIKSIGKNTNGNSGSGINGSGGTGGQGGGPGTGGGNSGGNCYDGIKNGNEDDVDIGGRCSSNIGPGNCYDGIKNGNEDDVDIGGRCINIVPNGPEWKYEYEKWVYICPTNNLNCKSNQEVIRIDCTPKAIEFTPEETAKLKVLQERFYKVSAEIRTEEDVNTLIRTRQNYYDYLSSDYAKTSSKDYTKTGVVELTRQCFDERSQAIKKTTDTIENDRKKITENINKITQDITILENGIGTMNYDLQTNLGYLDDNDYAGKDYVMVLIDGVNTKITKKVINANVAKLKTNITKDTKKLADLKLEKEKKTTELNGLSLSGRPLGLRLNPFITKSAFDLLLKNISIKKYFESEVRILTNQISKIDDAINNLKTQLLDLDPNTPGNQDIQAIGDQADIDKRLADEKYESVEWYSFDKKGQKKENFDATNAWYAADKKYLAALKIFDQKNREIGYLKEKKEKLVSLLDQANNNKFSYLLNNVSYVNDETPSKKETELSRKNRVYWSLNDIFFQVFNYASPVLDKMWRNFGSWQNPLTKAGFAKQCQDEKINNPELIIVVGDHGEGGVNNVEDNDYCYEKYYPMQDIERMLGIW